jgi:hypothetical protein
MENISKQGVRFFSGMRKKQFLRIKNANVFLRKWYYFFFLFINLSSEVPAPAQNMNARPLDFIVGPYLQQLNDSCLLLCGKLRLKPGDLSDWLSQNIIF